MNDEALHEALNRNVDLRDEVDLWKGRANEWKTRATDAEAENARLRAVVEADRRFLAHDGPVEGDEARDLWEAYREAHRALDGYEVESFDAGEGT